MESKGKYDQTRVNNATIDLITHLVYFHVNWGK